MHNHAEMFCNLENIFSVCFISHVTTFHLQAMLNSSEKFFNIFSLCGLALES